jgi:hypothetical protein
MDHRRSGFPPRSPDRAERAIRSGGGAIAGRAGPPIIAAMPTYHLPDAVRSLVEWTARYAARRRLSSTGAAPAGPLTPRDAAHVIRTIDAVCAAAPAGDLPFERYALLDELGASLADWLRHVSPDRAPTASAPA